MTVYLFKNELWGSGPHGSGWHSMYRELIDYLQDAYDVELICVSNKDGLSHLYVEKFDYYLPDCEILIYDEDNDTLKAISFAETQTAGHRKDLYHRLWDVFAERNNEKDLFLITQFNNWGLLSKNNEQLRQFEDSGYNFKVSPTVFYTTTERADWENIYEQRQSLEFSQLYDKLFMLSSHDSRPDVHKLSEMGILNKSLEAIKDVKLYAEEAIKYKIGLAIGTSAEYSYREIEYMASGIPFMRIKYTTELEPALIPNYHYISIDRQKYDMPLDNRSDLRGGEKYVNAYHERFLEVKDDKDFLDEIVRNAREYYVEYCSKKNRVKHVRNLINL